MKYFYICFRSKLLVLSCIRRQENDSELDIAAASEELAKSLNEQWVTITFFQETTETQWKKWNESLRKIQAESQKKPTLTSFPCPPSSA